MIAAINALTAIGVGLILRLPLEAWIAYVFESVVYCWAVYLGGEDL